MQGAMSWSIPFTRIAGIMVRIHLFFIIFMVAQVGQAASKHGGEFALQVFIYMIMLFAIVLMHELGHCFAARSVGGSAEDILLWPLGGLAYVNHPQTPWASFITTAGGPAVNLILFLVAGIVILILGYWPPIHPLWQSFAGTITPIHGKEQWMQELPWYSAWLIRFFHLNWFLFWFNVLCIGFPMDGGRLLQAALWPRYGHYTATKIACYCGFGVAVLLGLWAIIFLGESQYFTIITTFMLSFFIFTTCQQELQRIEMGGMDETPYGDFSQGYTSLERGNKTKDRKPSMFQRWMAERAEKKKQREEEEQLAEDQRIDELLAKINDGGGIQALTSEEQRFMRKASAKLRQKRNSK